jgi:cytoskeletal protein CcmA (bactofilin family)
MQLRGEIAGEGDFHVYGRFEGEIDVSGRVVVAEAAQVDANINAASILIAGRVRGNLSATTHLDILPTGVLTGTLKAGSFSAAEGSSVKGEIWLERAGASRLADAPLDHGEDRR